MDYEKAYKAVLHTATQWIKDGCTDKEKICLECVFPELRDSEDERIRKWMIDEIKTIYDFESPSLNPMVEKALAYLEKQKELPFVKDVVLGFPGLYFYDGERMHFRGNPALEDSPYYFAMKQQEEKQKEPENVSASTMAPSCWVEEPSLQKEQKPAECIEFNNEFKNQVSHLLVSVLNKEWEYNKEFVEYAAQQLLGYAKHEIQPAEWSEEDEDMLNCCISSIEEAKENRYAYKETDGDTSYDHEIAWLKSLRPSWKPSEEQMYALGTVVKGVGEASVGSIAYNLKDLYEQLKKL